MTASECLIAVKAGGADFQRAINSFIDDFRRADDLGKRMLVTDPLIVPGTFEGLVAAVVSALCREAKIEAPSWVNQVFSPEPFFAFPSCSFALRVRLMLESPAPFRIRNVFVPENYLDRA